MNGIKVRKAEQKILTEIESGHLASRVMKLPVVSDRMLQESEDENETSKKNSLAEEAKIREKVLKKANQGRKDNKKKADKKEEPEEPKVDYKDISKLAEELKPKELRKIIMAYIGALGSMPEDQDKRIINVEAVVAGVNTEKDLDFFAEFFVSLGQNCLRVEKGFKVGHMLVTMAQVKTIRARGVLVKEHIVNGPVQEKVQVTPPAKEMRIAAVETVVNNPSVEKRTEVQSTSKPDEIEEIVLLDDDDEDEPQPMNIESGEVGNLDQSLEKIKLTNDNAKEPSASQPLEANNEIAKSVEIEKQNLQKEADIDEIVLDEEEAKSVLEKYTMPQLRVFLKHFIKMTDCDSGMSLADLATEAGMEEAEVRAIIMEVTGRCAETPVVDGKRQSLKLQGIFLNSNWVEKIVKFNFQ